MNSEFLLDELIPCRFVVHTQRSAAGPIIVQGKPRNKVTREDEMWAYVPWKRLKPHERAAKPDAERSPKEQALNEHNKRPKQTGVRKEWNGNRKHRQVGDPSGMDADDAYVERIDARYQPIS